MLYDIPTILPTVINLVQDWRSTKNVHPLMILRLKLPYKGITMKVLMSLK